MMSGAYNDSMLGIVLDEWEDVGLVCWDETGTIQRITQGFQNLTGITDAGFTRADALWDHLRQEFEPDPGDLDRLMVSDESIDFHFIGESSGEPRYLRFTLRKINQLSVLYIRDVSELHRKPGKKDRSDEVLQGIFRQLPVALAVVDKQRRVLQVSDAALAMVGMQADELIGQSTRKLYPNEKAFQQIHEVLYPPKSSSVITQGKRKNGETFDVEVTMAPLLDDDNEVIAYVAAIFDITDKLIREDELKRYELIVNSSSDSLLFIDKEFHYRAVNESYLKLRQMQRGELIGQPVSKIVGARFFEQTLKPRLQRCLGGQKCVYSGKIALPQNRHTFIEASFNPHHDASGKITGVVVNVRDVSKRISSENALRESEQRARALLEAMPDQMFRLSRDGTYLDYKAHPEDLLQQNITTLVGSRLQDTAPPDFSSLIMSKIALTLESGQMQSFEYDLDIPQKGERNWEARMVPSGENEVIATVRDITKQKSSHQRLQTLSQVVEQSPDAILLTDTEFRVTYLNTSFEALYGWTLEDLIGTLPNRLNAETNALDHQSDLYQRIASGERVTSTALNRRKDGSLFQCEYWVSSLRNDDGRVVGYMGSQRDITQRITAERALAASEARYRQIIETAMEGIWLIDTNAVTTFVNARMAEILGYKQTEMDGRSLFDFMDEEAALQAHELIAGRMAGQSAIHEFRFRHHNGTAVWTQVSAAAIKGDSDAVIGAFAMITDITERLQQEQERLKLMTEREILLDHSPALIYYKDTNNNILRVTKSVAEVTGLPREQIEGRPSREIYPHMSEIYYQDDQGVIQSGVPRYGIIEQIHSVDGTSRWFMTDKYPHYDHNNSVIGLVVFSIEITKIKQAEESLRDSEQKYRTLFEQIAQGVVIHDPKGKIVECNPSAMRILGRSRDEILGLESESPEWQCIHEDGSDFPGETHPTTQSLRSATPKSAIMGVYNLRKNSYVWILVDAVPLFEQDQKPVGVFSSFTDITEVRELQQALIQSQKLEAVGRLTGGIAHDFNNILGGVLGFTDLARRRNAKADEKLHEYLEQIETSGIRARDLVRQLLIYSRGEYSKEIQPTGINPMIREIEKLLRPILPATISIKLELAETTLIVAVNPLHLHQIVINLCLNAKDAMPDGGHLVIATRLTEVTAETCFITQQRISGQWVELSITDSGSGIKPEQLEFLFQPFFTTKEVGEGSGMGLAVIAGLLRSYQGHVIVESEPGKGSKFRVLLPVTEDTESKPVETADDHEDDFSRLYGSRILLVEDESSLLAYYQQLLTEIGAVVTPCSTGKEALKAIHDNSDRFDVIVSDIQMPGMDGLKLIELIRKLDQNIEAIIVSGDNKNLTSEIVLRHRIAGVILKPVQRDELLTQIANALSNGQQQ